jgi:hypothetical protein
MRFSSTLCHVILVLDLLTYNLTYNLQVLAMFLLISDFRKLLGAVEMELHC